MRTQALITLLACSFYHCAPSDVPVMDGSPDMGPDPACHAGQVAPVGTNFFVDISDASGIRKGNYDPAPTMPIPINDHSHVNFADINGDGYDDIVMHNLSKNPASGVPFEHLVFLNNKDGTFRDFSDESGLRNSQTAFFAFADIDNDGDEDIFAGLDNTLAGLQHQIWLNDGSGHFTHKLNAGVENIPPTDGMVGSAVFADFNNDGKLDLYMANGDTYYKDFDQLFFGNGDGTFTEVTQTNLTGPNPYLWTNGAVACDYDNDGDLDIFTATANTSFSFSHDRLWENDGTGVFTDVAFVRGFAAQPTGNYYLASTGNGTLIEPDKMPATYMGGNGYGIDCQDLNGDGYPDIFETNVSHPVDSDYPSKWSDPSLLLINQGPSGQFAFVNEFLKRGLPFNEGDTEGAIVDFDNDGRFDLALSRDIQYESAYPQPDQKAWFGLMHQLPNGNYQSVGLTSGINDESPMAKFQRLKGAQNQVWSDIDHDGDLDLLVGGRDLGSGRPNFLFRNDLGSKNPWIAVRLRGDGQAVNRDAIGAKVTVEVSGQKWVRELKASRSTYSSADGRALVFGLGDASCSPKISVRWPNGKTDVFPSVPIGHYLTIDMVKGLSQD